MATCILTSLFYHENKDLTNFYLFVEFLKNSKLIDQLFVCEITHSGESCLSTNLNIKNHYVLKNKDPLWHKEAAINYLFKNLPTIYDKIIVMDNDISFSDPDWFKKIDVLLDGYLMVQPFDFVKYYGPDNIGIDSYNKSLVYSAEQKEVLGGGNPGLCVGYRREYLDATEGLFDKCLIGGGDDVNIIPFYYDTHYVNLDILNRVFYDHKIDMLNYWDIASKYVRNSKYKKCTYINNCVAFHKYHGSLSNRQYGSRYSIINELSSNMVIIGDNGLYTLGDGEECESLRYNLDSYFSNRLTKLSYADPCIFNTTKYQIDNNTLWLSDYNLLSFINIDKVKLHLHKICNLNYINILHNNQIVSYNFNNDYCVIELNNPKKLIIDCDYFIPKLKGASSDERKLSIYLSKIEIVKKNSTDYEIYPLNRIL